MTEALSGVENTYRNAVVYNAAAGLLIAGKVVDLKAGALMAKEAIDNGRAHKVLKKLVEVTNTRALTDTLSEICAAKREHIAKRKTAIRMSRLLEKMRRQSRCTAWF